MTGQDNARIRELRWQLTQAQRGAEDHRKIAQRAEALAEGSKAARHRDLAASHDADARRLEAELAALEGAPTPR